MVVLLALFVCIGFFQCVLINTEMFDFLVDEVIEKTADTNNPIIVTFQNGDLKPKTEKQFCVNIDDTGTSYEISDGANNVYVPSDFVQVSTNRQFIAICNKVTHKTRLIEVEYASLINKLFVKKHEESNKESANMNVANNNHVDKMFVGKRTLKRIDHGEKYKVNPLLVKDEIESSIADVKLGDLKMTTGQLEDNSINTIIPKCKRDAGCVSDVYNLYTIVSMEELDEFSSSAEEILDSSEPHTGCSQFFSTCLAEALKSDEDTIEKVCALMYMDCILRSIKLNIKTVSFKSSFLSICSNSSMIRDKIVNDFFIQNDKTLLRPAQLKDKALCYCLVIAFLCCNFTINLETFKQDTSLGQIKISQLCRAVGATPAARGSQTYTIKVPLPALPTVSKPKSRRK